MPIENESNRLKLIETDKIQPVNPEIEKTSMFDSAAMDMVLLGIKTLSQRAIVAFSTLFTLLTCASVFVLCYIISPSPNSYQLVELAIYCGFVLLLHLVRRKDG
jgi:hypothetical protein